MLLEAITKPYANYIYYKGTFLGSVISSESDFNKFSLRAEAELDRMTFGRIPKLVGLSEELVTAIKNAVCEMTEITSTYVDMNQYVKSESNDGFSQSYDGNPTKTYAKQLRMSADKWLGETGLLYRGGGQTWLPTQT